MDEIALGIVIFVLRVANYSIGTIRLVVITRNRRGLAAALATLEAFVFAVTIANVVTDLENLVNLASYCLGAAVGSYIGMVLEARLIHSFVIINVIAVHNGHEIAESLREAGHGVTEFAGRGREGDVITLRSVVDKRDVAATVQLIRSINEKAFIAVEEARSVQHGWMRASIPGRPRGYF